MGPRTDGLGLCKRIVFRPTFDSLDVGIPKVGHWRKRRPPCEGASESSSFELAAPPDLSPPHIDVVVSPTARGVWVLGAHYHLEATIPRLVLLARNLEAAEEEKRM